MKALTFLIIAYLPFLFICEPINISGRELPIHLDKKGTYKYIVEFEKANIHGTYYISAQEMADNKEEKKQVKLLLGGDCIQKCSNLINELTEENNCGINNDFLGKYYLVKLFPNQACNLYFTVETSMEINLLVHHQPTIQVNDIQTVPIMFHIPNAPIFLEYTPKFPPNFVSQAKIYVEPAETKDIKNVFFGKDADHQDCNTHFPCEEKHCYAFELPDQYFIAFSYVTTITSNLYIAIYPSDDQISETKVKIGFTLPFILKGFTCPEHQYLARFNEDTFCKDCEEHCSECNELKCEKCEEGYAIFKGKCIEHECESFEQFKNTDGKCVDCKENCQYCEQEKCLECKEGFVLIDEECQEKVECQKGQFYNNNLNKCEDCMSGCEVCVEQKSCKKCMSGLYYLNVESACVPSPVCRSNQYLSENQQECLECGEKCEKCKNDNECLECEKGYEVKKGICTKYCGVGKFYDNENKKCEYCVKNCKECSDSKTCEVCKGGWHLSEFNTCKENALCKPGQYLAPSRESCSSCPKQCTSCKNETFCQNCIKDYSLVGHQICEPSCPKYSYYEVKEKKCNKCLEHCEKCMDDSSCEVCRKGFKYSMKEGKCVQSLGAGAVIIKMMGVLAILLLTLL